MPSVGVPRVLGLSMGRSPEYGSSWPSSATALRRVPTMRWREGDEESRPRPIPRGSSETRGGASTGSLAPFWAKVGIFRNQHVGRLSPCMHVRGLRCEPGVLFRRTRRRGERIQAWLIHGCKACAVWPTNKTCAAPTIEHSTGTIMPTVLHLPRPPRSRQCPRQPRWPRAVLHHAGNRGLPA